MDLDCAIIAETIPKKIYKKKRKKYFFSTEKILEMAWARGRVPPGRILNLGSGGQEGS
jgi:hypothetical protein